VIRVDQHRTLIAYITKGAATEEAASAVANVLRNKCRFEVDLVDLKKNPFPDIAGYKNVIIGSGVRMQRVYREALKFLEKNDFGNKKVAFLFHQLKLEIQRLVTRLSLSTSNICWKSIPT